MRTGWRKKTERGLKRLAFILNIRMPLETDSRQAMKANENS